MLFRSQLFHCIRAGSWNRKKVQMESNDTGRRLSRNLSSNLGTPIAALNPPSGVTQTIHHDDKCFGHAHRVPTATGRWPRKSKTGKRRYNDIKSRRIAVLRMRKRLDQSKEFRYRARPS